MVDEDTIKELEKYSEYIISRFESGETLNWREIAEFMKTISENSDRLPQTIVEKVTYRFPKILEELRKDTAKKLKKLKGEVSQLYDKFVIGEIEGDAVESQIEQILREVNRLIEGYSYGVQTELFEIENETKKVKEEIGKYRKALSIVLSTFKRVEKELENSIDNKELRIKISSELTETFFMERLREELSSVAEELVEAIGESKKKQAARISGAYR